MGTESKQRPVAARKSMLPRSWCVDYTPRGAWSLVAKYSEGMEEDASLMSGIKDRHLTEEGRERGREVDMLAVIVQFYISRPSPPSLPPSPTSSLSAPLPNRNLWQQGNQCFPVLGVSLIHREGLVLARQIFGGHGGGCAGDLGNQRPTLCDG